MREKGRLARFEAYSGGEPDDVMVLAEDHWAVVDGRTLFKNTVVGPFESKRFLVSGQNSSKIGREIEKGPWSGLPVFTLTLEERATCPRSCDQWRTCYGAGMPLARRNDALHPDFIPALKAEVVTLVREVCSTNPLKPEFKPPAGLVIRLHILGDFFSVGYVKMWGDLLKFLPELRVWGYTARRADDPKSQAIACALAELAVTYPDRWVIRTSHSEPGAGRTIVVDRRDDPRLFRDDVIVCPVEEKRTENCATCGLCWSANAWSKTVAFVLHGPTPRSRPGGARAGGRGRHAAVNARGFTAAQEDIYQALLRLADERGVVSANVLAVTREAGVSAGNWHVQIKALLESRYVQRLRDGGAGLAAVYRVFAEPQAEFPPAPALPLPTRKTAAKIRIRDPRPASAAAKPLVARKPDEPLMRRQWAEPEPEPEPEPKRRIYKVERRYHKRTGALLNPQVVGSAGDYDPDAAAQRIESLDEAERRRIAEAYGASFVQPKKEPAE